MELFFLRHAQWASMYNCSAPDLAIDLVPLAERTQYPAKSFVNGVLSVVYTILYIPCMLSIWKRRGESSCYAILFYIGCMDLVMLLIIGFLQTELGYEGAVFCSHPLLIYFAGMAAGGITWVCESTAHLVLAINRCLDIGWPKVNRMLFKSRRTAIWLALVSVYGFYYALMEPPDTFSAINFGWFTNPFAGYRDDTAKVFVTNVALYHDMVVGFGTPGAYILFGISLLFKKRSLGASGQSAGGITGHVMSRAEKMVFLQVFLISLLCASGPLSYIVLAKVVNIPWINTLSHFIWLHIHGFPPVIYLCLNKTIRDDSRKLLRRILCKREYEERQMVNNRIAFTQPTVGRRITPISYTSI